MELSIECRTREAGTNPKALRRQGLLPAVLYGHRGAESVALTIEEREAEKLVRRAAINNTLITVKVPEIAWSGKALLREVQSHPWKDKLYHLSFFSVATQDSVEVVVPVHYQGTPIGVSRDGGILDAIMSELALRCAPDVIPEAITVDVTSLEIGQNLHVSNLKLPAGVEVVADTDKTLVMVAAPRKAATETDSGEATEVITVMEGGLDA